MKPTKLIAALAALIIPLLGFFACANVKVSDAGAWRDVPAASNVYVSDGAAWRTGTQVYVSDGASWQPVYVGSTTTAIPLFIDDAARKRWNGSWSVVPGQNTGGMINPNIINAIHGDFRLVATGTYGMQYNMMIGNLDAAILDISTTVGGTFALTYDAQNVTYNSGTWIAETVVLKMSPVPVTEARTSTSYPPARFTPTVYGGTFNNMPIATKDSTSVGGNQLAVFSFDFAGNNPVSATGTAFVIWK